MTEVVLDGKGATIAVGSRVRAGVPDVDDLGTVTQITDVDGDVDDEGRSVAYLPQVHVRFDDGVEDSFGSYWSATGPWDEDAPFVCDDVEVVS